MPRRRVTTHPSTEVQNFVVAEIQKARNFVPGPQFADDPLRLREVMQRTLTQFGGIQLSQDQIRRLYELFQIEAQQYRQRHHQYLSPDAYAGVLDDIKKMLERMEL